MNGTTSNQLSGLEDHLGYWLRHVSGHVSAAFARALQARQVSVAEWVALRHIYDHPAITPGELATAIGMTRGAVSKVLDKLEHKQWVAVTAGMDDNRMRQVMLTPAGQQVLPELAQIADANDARFFSSLTGDEQHTLKSLLQKLAQIHQWHDMPIE